MKKIVIALVLMLFTAMFVATGLSEAQPKPIVMKLAETHPQDYPTTKGDYEFARLVKERSNGRIIIEVFHSKQLGEERAVIEQVQLGAIDMTRVSISAVSSFVRELDAFQLPYLYRDANHMWKVLNGPIGADIFKKHEAVSFVGVGWFEGGSRNFYTKKLVKTVGDLKGMKIRVQQAPLMVGMVNPLALWLHPCPMARSILHFRPVLSTALRTTGRAILQQAITRWRSTLLQMSTRECPRLPLEARGFLINCRKKTGPSS